jgi:hypothetical protein
VFIEVESFWVFPSLRRNFHSALAGAIAESCTAYRVFRDFHTCGGDGGFILNTYN